MNQSTSKTVNAANVCRRLAALLATLALLASMTLPAYAEALENAATAGDTQTTASEVVAEKPAASEDNSTPDTTGAGETANDETDTTENDNSGDTDETPANDVTTPDTPAEDDTQSDADDNDASDATDTINPADSTINQDSEEAEEDVPENVLATQATGDSFTVYFAVPTGWADVTEVKFWASKGNVGNPGDTGDRTMTLLEGVKTKDGRQVYSIALTSGTGKDCPYGGFAKITFKTAGKSDISAIMESNKDGSWLELSKFANDFYCDGNTGEWRDYNEVRLTDHTYFKENSMVFENQAGTDLQKVLAVFCEKNEDGLQEVETIDLGAVAAGKRASFKIPSKACSYIKFRVDGVDTKLYSFYGKQDGNEQDSYFVYDTGKTYCYVYQANDTNSTWGIPQGKITIYFDATLSELGNENNRYGMPDKGYGGHQLYYYAIMPDGSPVYEKMTQDSENASLWSVSLNSVPAKIRFATWAVSDESAAGHGDGTAMLTVPTDLNEPCFYADTSDNAIYDGGNRSGYWAEKGTLRDAETGKSTEGNAKDVVDINQVPFTANAQTKYVTSTLYDYYTDYELNGNNRDSYPTAFEVNQRNWVTFRQFNQAISDYYNDTTKYTGTVTYPIYTGHFQPDELGGNYLFSQVAETLNLFGWSSKSANSVTYRNFMAANNSHLDAGTEGTKKYAYAFQGIVGQSLVNGSPVMNKTDLAEPHFNEEFLTQTNSKNTKLGEVYHNVSFPFTKNQVFGDEPGVDYWWFDSASTSLYLRQDTTTDKLYLGNDGANGKTANVQDPHSLNVDSSSKNGKDEKKNDRVSTPYGFFPFNEKSTSLNANTYNYGFGAKLEIPFTLTSDGTVKANGDKNVPIRFYFSGDDDVWVFIDGKLVLDIGGAHGKVSGILEFDKKNGKDNIVTSYVSKVKYNQYSADYGAEGNPVRTISYLKNSESYYKQDSVEIKNLYTGQHTLTMYYMERGMWESNMAVAFNFPDHNELEVEKEVNLAAVNSLFQNCFKNQELFTFNIKNQATHYPAKEAQGTGTVETKTINLTDATPSPATTNMGDKNLFKLDTNPNPETTDTGQVLHWYAQYTDTNSQYREKRYGILTLDDAIDISKMKYLTFKVYVASATGQSTPSISNMYLELRDAAGKRKGGVNGASLSGTTYGTVTMAENRWITIKLNLDKLKAEDEFSGSVASIYFGCNYPRDIYLKDFEFTSAVPDAGMVGFTTQQQDIPDYGSATSGKLENAFNARFTSTKANAGTQVVDKNGNFLLADGETVTFTDQFRRGSYISLNEVLDKDLFTTTWTLYENGQEVTKMVDGETVQNPTEMPNLVNNGDTSGPDDGRKEVYVNNETANAGYTETKKPDANTIVFRSYSTPDSDSDAAFTKLKVKYVNTVKTGSLTIKKAAPEGESLDGTYKFRITFSNVGGLSLETDPIPTDVEIKGTSSTTIDGIPLGTRFRIEEIDEGDAHLQSVKVDGCTDGEVVDGKLARGTVQNSDTKVEVTFTNTKHELFDLDLTKEWKDINNNDVTTDLPEQIYVQLQRKLTTEADTQWKAVEYPEGSEYVTVTPDNGGWNYKFANLDATQWDSPEDEKPRYVYRVVEGTLEKDENGKDVFTPVANGGTLLLNSNVYQVSYGDVTATEDGNSAITLTNTLQNPEFNLDVIKKSADDGTFLEGVEFTLDKLDESGNAITTDGYPKYGITNDQGQLMLKGENGEVTTTKAFENLDAGTYRLTETKTKAGYSLLSGPIKIQFTKDGECYLNNSKIEVSTTEQETEFSKSTTDGSYTLALTVLNRKVPELPHTGADAPSLWLLIGLPLAVAGLLILVFRYNKKGGRTK